MSMQSAQWIAAARVLRRSGFGTTGPEVDSALSQASPTAHVTALLSADFDSDRGVATTPMPDLEVLKPPARTSEGEYRDYSDKKGQQREELKRWWIRRMAAVEHPTREKLTFLWHNHFATSAEKVSLPKLMTKQNAVLRRLCLGDFRVLAYAMLTDAAMIKWLDGHRNKAGSPNENLAREFMELFALGHDNGYSEQDVRQGARALTGWIVRDDGETELVRTRYDRSAKTILGTTGDIGAAEFCDTVLKQPQSARFIAGRLWQQLASDDPPSDPTLERLVAAYEPSRDLHALTTAILTDADFFKDGVSVITGPVEWLVGTLRALRVPLDESKMADKAVDTLQSLGQLPFYPPDVGGWARGRAWLTTSATGVRMRIANDIVHAGDLSIVADSPATERIDAAGYLLGIGAWSDRSAKALKPLRKNAASLIAAAVNTPEYLTS